MKATTNTIKKEYSSVVLVISPHQADRNGGIAILVNTLSKYYDKFNYVTSTRSNNIFLMSWYFINSIIKLIYYILFKRIEIVHIHGASYGSFFRKMILIHIASFFRVKIIYHIHGGGFKAFYKKYNKYNIIKKTLKKVDVLFVLSNTWKSFFSEIIPPSRIFIINNVIEKVKNPNLSIRSVDDSFVKFLFLGHIFDGKGIFDLLHVIATNRIELLERNFQLFIGGSGETQRLQDVIETERLNELVRFEGWVSGEEKQKLLAECSVYVLPSYKEGLPISILEAMSYGRPVISTTIGGIPEIITSGYNGILITPGDSDAIFAAIIYMLTHSEERTIMGRRSLEIIKDFYPNAVLPKINERYKELLSKKYSKF
jgi:Glycosyltransferase